MMKKTIALGLACLTLLAALTGCGGNNNNSGSAAAGTAGTAAAGTAAASGSITVCSREDGSGTRGAFIELFGIEEKDADGNKMDNTVATAEITNSTAVMMQTVAGNPQAIGYVSLGSLSDTVKALKIDGAEATAAGVKDGTYKVSRPFNIVTKDGTVNEAAQDFIDYMLSDEGQKIVEDNGYVSESSTGAFAGGNASGKVTVTGSSSVTPVMEKLSEAYQALNSGVTIEVQENDSTTGITSTSEGVCDIGMASRALSDEETAAGVTAQVIALDGIAVIVNQENGVSDLTSDQVKSIFTGSTTDWSAIGA